MDWFQIMNYFFSAKERLHKTQFFDPEYLQGLMSTQGKGLSSYVILKKSVWFSRICFNMYLLNFILISEPFPLQITLIAIFAGVILVLLVTILVILFRRRICCYDKDGDKVSGTSTDSSALANNVILKVRIIEWDLGTGMVFYWKLS